MQETVLTIRENMPLTDQVFRMTLEGKDLECQKPGQFVNIGIEGLFLRRPISVYDSGEGYISIIYKTVGKGTVRMSEMKPGEELNVLTGLGNGYDLSLSGDRPLLIGGGVGVPPLYYLAKQLVKLNKKVTVILGFNKKEEIFYEEEFKELGCEVIVCTVDGSYGTKGFVTAPMKDLNYSYFYTCGPLPMLKAVYDASNTEGQFSFEERMGCGYGVCMGCTTKVKGGYKRICKEGPVLNKEEILWED